MPTANSKLQELIDKLPEQFRDVAQRYLPALIEAGLDQGENIIIAQVETLLSEVSGGHWQDAYRAMVERMSKEQLAAEHQRINELWARTNTDNAALINLQRQAVRDVLTAGLLLVRAAVTS